MQPTPPGSAARPRQPSRPTRRRVLTAGAAALAAPLAAQLAPAGAPWPARRANAAERLPLSVVNQTGRFPDSAIWAYIVGTNQATGEQSYVRADGALIPVTPSLNGPDGYADLSIPLPALGAGFALPHLSGRVYLSIDDKLRFQVVADGGGRPALRHPAGWVGTDPNYGVLYDCAEFTFNAGGMFCNTTMVDMFSVPLAITLTGTRTQHTGALVPGGRGRIFAALRGSADFGRLVVGDDLRVIAPGHGIDAGLFPAGYLDAYIDQVWSTYAASDLTVETAAGTRTGRVQGAALVFDGGVAPFRRPTTRDVLFCDGALAAPNDGRTGPVAAVLGAAFNRTVLRDHPRQPTADPALYYRAEPAHHYARAMHDNTQDGRAYGFAFDDVLDQAAYIQDLAPTSVAITLTPFG